MHGFRRASSRPTRPGLWLGISALICAGLVAGAVSPASAGEAGERHPAVELGAFALGDGLEAALGERDGSLRFAASAGGVGLTWDSRAIGIDRSGFGHGWSVGLASIDTDGGVRVFPASGGAYEADASQPTGLHGYPRDDVRFVVADPDSVLDARGDAPAVGYAYELHELGGRRTLFSEAGDPVAAIDGDGRRHDWRWLDGDVRRLSMVIDPDGVSTTLDWSDPTRVVVRPGANVTAAREGSGVGGEWHVGLARGAVSEIVDPVGATTTVTYDDGGRVERIWSDTGAATAVSWHASPDDVARVETIRTLDRAGAELSGRRWAAVGGPAAVSAWPAVADAVDAEHATELSDGKTTVVSTYGDSGAMTRRATRVTTGSGDLTVHEQRFSFEVGRAPAGRPTAVELTYRDAVGAERTARETYDYDEFGRVVRRASADGTVTELEYDPVVPSGALLPIGLAVRETVTAPDGLVSVTTSEPTPERTAAAVVETATGGPRAPGKVTARTERTVVAGVLTEERSFPGGDATAAPVRTTREQHVDLVAGTRTTVETVAAGTEAAATISTTESLVHGGVLEQSDAVGGITSTSYDEAGRPVETTDPAGRATTRVYADDGDDGMTSVSIHGPDGVTVTEERDELGRLVRLMDDVAPDGRVQDGYRRVIETRAHPSPGVEEVTDAWGATTRTERDLYGRPTHVTLPTGLVQVTEYDDIAGTVTSGTSPTGSLAGAEQTATRRFDDAGRLVETTGLRADGLPVPTAQTTYDGLGRELGSDNGSTATRVEYDESGNPATTVTGALVAAAHDSGSSFEPEVDTTQPATAQSGAAQLTAVRRFDGFGRSLEKTVSTGAARQSGGSRELDALGRTTAETDQAGVRTEFRYTPDGLLERETSADGTTTSHTYDVRTRQMLETRVSAPGRAEAVTGFEYDPSSDRLTAVFDPRDRAGTEITYSYGALGNQTEIRYPGESGTAPGPRIVHEYDPHGRKLATIDAAGTRTEFSYDGAGLLREAEQTDTAGEHELTQVAYARDSHGRVTTLTRGNGVVTQVTYTSTNQIASETTRAGGAVQSEREYEYDPASGNLLARVDRTRDDDGALVPRRTEYTFDALGRLVRSTERQGDTADAPAIRSTAYELAASGDVLSETVTEDPTGAKPSTTTRRFGYTVVGALETITTTDLDGAEHVQRQVHDAAGNLVEDADGTVYTWDAANRQLSETRPDGTTIDTGYWADGSRQHRSTADRSTTFYWDGDTLAAERHTERSGLPAEAPALAAAPALAEGGSGGTVSYLLGLTRHARTTTGDAGETSTTYYGTDRHGNVTDLTDEHGELAAAYAYSDYGDRTVVRPQEATDLERNPFGFAMEYTHDDGSQFLHVRTYDPGRMHFRSRDREELHNVYGFANANPIMLVDPSGRDAIMDWLPVALGAYGAAAALSGVMALITATGAVGPVALIGAAFGIVDALYTASDAVLVKSGVDLMSNDIRIGIGAGFAAVGTLFAAGGLIKLALKPWHRFETMVTGNLEKRLDKFWPPDGETALQTLQYRLYGRVPGQQGGHDLAIRQLRSKYVGELDDESLGLVANQSSEHQTRFALALQLKDAMRFNKHALDHTRMLRKKLQEGLEAEGSSDEWITSLGLEINGLIDQASSSLEEAIKRLRTAKQSPLLAPSPAQAASEFGASATGDFDRVIDDMTATLGAITSLKRF